MPTHSAIVLVSNRGPISFVDADGRWKTKRGAGGLAGALDPVARQLGDDAVWIAATNSEADRMAVAAGVTGSLREELGYRMRMVVIDPDVYARYYDEVSNRMLWFANHCLWDEIDIKRFGDQELDAWESCYEPVNRMFAEAAADVALPESLVLFQDYHLATAPGHLRRLHPQQAIGHFTHSSFCGPDGLERLPRPIPRRVIEGMLGADLVGFHVPAWAKGFLACCQRIGAVVDRERWTVEHESRTSWVRTYPIPIEAGALIERSREPKATLWAERFVKESPGKLIARADRTEPSKNIVRGFEAFGLLLDRRADLRGKVRFIACVYPSRQSMPEYRDYATAIERSAEAINERYPGSIDLYMKDDFDRTLGALRVYDVLLVNPIMDGMNLVSKEGPTINERDGVLVLSTGAGSFEELGDESIVISEPRDVDATSDALERALELPAADRKAMSEALRRKASSTKPEEWIEAQLGDLQAIRDGGAPESPAPH